MRIRTLVLAAWCLGAALVPARADLKLAGLFTDHMVLQRNARVHLWGTAAPGELIRVRPSWYENDAAVTAMPDGRFLVALTTPEAAGPHTIRLQGRNRVELSDVLLGEVWLASGQSNMEMGVGFQQAGYSGVDNWEQELADAARPRIRFFTVENQVAPSPLEEVRGAWTVADSKSVKNFSAAAWFFAKRLERELDVPIGVIASDWGGTPAEAWTSPGALAGFPRFTAELAACAALQGDPAELERQRSEAAVRYTERLAVADPLTAAKAQTSRFDDHAWESCEVPGKWAGELADFDGAVWMRRTLEIPAEWRGKVLELSLGMIDDDETTWWNGTQVGSTQGWQSPRKYRISAELSRASSAVIAVRVIDTGGDGGFHDVPATLYLGRADTREKLPLAGAWKRARGAAIAELPSNPTGYQPGPNTPGALFNGMIAPLRHTALAGVIWYQGESNIVFAEEYAQLFPALIRDWRAHFERELPFYFVQIAPHAYRGDKGACAQLRESQRAALQLAGTGMVVTLDIGDPRDIHPKNKQEVGHRLASFALRDVYGHADVACEAPSPRTASAAEGALVVGFEGDEALEECGPSAFELAGEDGRFEAATQLVLGRDSVALSAAGVAQPTQVRYAWKAAPNASLRGAKSHLPVAPFILKVR